MSTRTNDIPTPHPMTFSEKMAVFGWRRLAMPLLEMIGGKAAPSGRVTEHSYGELRDERLDRYTRVPGTSQLPTVVHIHGGGWIAGSKGRFYHRPLLKLADRGHAVYSLNYPLSPEHPHPQALRSLLQALVWIKKDHAENGSIHLIGDSAGGNLAMMLGLMLSDPRLLRTVDPIDPGLLPTLRSVVPIYGVLDRTSFIEDGFPSAKTFLKSYAGEQAWDAKHTPSIPVTPMDVAHVEHMPPTFIVGAGKDKLLRSSRMYSEAMKHRFPHVEYKEYEGADHGFFSFGKQSKELSEDLAAYIAKH